MNARGRNMNARKENEPNASMQDASVQVSNEEPALKWRISRLAANLPTIANPLKLSKPPAVNVPRIADHLGEEE